MSENLDPDEITKILKIIPTEIQCAGAPRSKDSDKLLKHSGWWISTKDLVNSLDARHHLDWILDQVSNKKNEIESFQQAGYLVDVCVRWDSYDRIISLRAGEYKAYFERGVLYREAKHDMPRHFADQIASAKLGFKYAQNNIGYYYLTGESGFPVNLQEAKSWLTLAADQGFRHAKDKLPLVEARLAAEKKKN